MNKAVENAKMGKKIALGQLYQTAVEEGNKQWQKDLEVRYEIEHEIKVAAEQLDKNLQQGIKRFEEALRNLRDDAMYGLNSCGLLQGTEEEVMCSIGKLKALYKVKEIMAHRDRDKE